MQSNGSAARIVATAGLLLETSAGSITIDVIGADCPALSANFLNLCRAEFWNGAVATEVIPEVAIFFSLTADPLYHSLLRATLDKNTGAAAAAAAAAGTTPLHSSVLSFWSLLPREEKGQAAAGGLHALPGTAAASASPPPTDPVDQQNLKLQHAIQQELRVCKRRRCVGLSRSPAPNSRETASAYHAVFAPAVATTAGSSGSASVSPCAVRRAGCLLVDVTAPTLRFGLTLSDRAMDFLDTQYVVIGHVTDGEAVLRRLQKAPLRPPEPPRAEASGSAEVVGGRPASAWPQPVRLVRVKRAVVLPTAGTEKFVASTSAGTAATALSGLSVASGAVSQSELLQQRQRISHALHQAGCFQWWASAAAVRAAHRELVRLTQQRLRHTHYVAPSRPRTIAEATALLHHAPPPAGATGESTAQQRQEEPFIILQERAPVGPDAAGRAASKSSSDHASEDVAEMWELTYNPHYTGTYLSSDDDDDDGSGRVGGGLGGPALSARQLEERRRLFMQQHQEKASETLSLMLNVLNGVADVRGDIKPPENVLFVCKLNPVTTGDGLALCFAQFGHVLSAEVIYDAKTKQSLCYGFVEFESVDACFRAFQKMDKALIDDCRIHVDFSQSVSKLWAQRQREMRKRDRVN